MACDVLLIDALSPLRVEKGLISPTVATAYLTGFFEQENISFEMLFALPQDDGQIDILKGNKIESGTFAATLKDIAPRMVFFFHDPELIHIVFAVHTEARKILPDAIFCASSITACAQPQFYYDRGFDCICGQDVFSTLPALVKKIKEGQHPSRDVYVIPRQYASLDHFPLIAEKYFNAIQPQWCFPDGHVEPFGLITSSLGCTGGCGHCPNSSFWGTTWVPMSAERIFKEIKKQRELLQVNSFYFGDINFCPNNTVMTENDGVHPYAVERLTRLHQLLDGYAPDIKFISIIRPDTIYTLALHYPQLLETYLKRTSSCFLGFESFSHNVLTGLDKKISRDMMKTAIKALAEKNVTIVASFLVGSPWETEETLAETEAFIMEDLPSSTIPLLNIMTPFPGTKFFSRMHDQGLILASDLTLFNGQHMLYQHPVFRQGELEEKVQQFYYKFFTERYTG
jgi:radical SAM superfamily enzyme YgiQ (UPF0313 family)